MRVMLTRPRADSECLAEELQARGNEVLIEPLLNIIPAGTMPSLDGVAGLIVTSANSIRMFCSSSSVRDLVVYAVGDATALVAQEAGFTTVESADGDAAALGAYIDDRVNPTIGTLLHIHGRKVTGNLDNVLIERGYSIRTAIVYDAEAATELSIPARNQLSDRKIDAALFFSPRTVKTFVRLVNEAGLADRCNTMTALCLSAAVAEAGSALTWRGMEIAQSPDKAAMLRLCDSVQESRRT
jgi:uroporphyrinogen-III synthase